MSELPKFRVNRQRPFDIEAVADEVVAKGHAIQGAVSYDDGDGKFSRDVFVFDKFDADMNGIMLGMGVDDTIEAALVRALYTYRKSRRSRIHPSELAEIDYGDIKPPLSGRSQFGDMMTYGTSFWIAKVDDDITAGLVNQEIGKLDVIGPDAFTALRSLIKMYHFRRHSHRIWHHPETLFHTVLKNAS